MKKKGNKNVSKEKRAKNSAPAAQGKKTAKKHKFLINNVKRFASQSIGRHIKGKIKVTFPDGKVICHDIVAHTFIDVIKEIGVKKISALNLMLHFRPLITKTPLGTIKRWADVGFGLRVNTNSSTKEKFSLLCEMNFQLNLGLKIELM